ncbi:mandelate racemase/muconate lactonizing enzyme family protein [Virgibacillus kimchii]
MKIKKVDIYGLKMDLIKPFIVSYDSYEDMPTILTRVETENGHVGWGEAVADQHVTGETWHSTFEVLRHELAPLVIDGNPFNINFIHQKMNEKIYGVPTAKAAIDLALYDLMGKISGQPVYRLIGGQAHDHLDIPNVISILSPETMAEEAKQLVEKGLKHVKIKVGTDPETDIARIRSVRQVLPDHIKLRVDANQGWTANEAIHVIEQTRDCKVEWYEQPTKAGDHEAMAEVRHATHVNIMADESIHGAEDLITLAKLRGADLINIKLMKTGGIYPALKLANLAETLRLPCQVGSMVESAVATMAGAHLSFSQQMIRSNEMVGPMMFKEDVAETEFRDGRIIVSERPGFGIDVDEAFVRRKAVKHDLVEAAS